MAKKYDGSPLFHMRMPEPLYDWLRGYSKRTGKPMAAIIKDYLFELQRKDEHAQQRKLERSPIESDEHGNPEKSGT